MIEKDLIDFEQRLHSVALPTINTPLHKSKLRTALVAELQKSARPRRGLPSDWLWALFATLRFHPLRLALPAAVLVVAAIVWQGLLMPPETLAYATLHANPAVQLTVDTRGRVTELTPLSPEAAAIFAPDDFRQVRAELAVAQIVTRLHTEGFLRQDAAMVLLLRSAPAMSEKRVGQLADTLQGALENSLLATGTGASLRRHTVSLQVYAGSRAAGLLPLDFVDLLDTELEDEDLLSLFHLQGSLALDEPVFRARFAAMARKVARELRANKEKGAALELGQKFMTEELDEDESNAEDEDDAEDRDKPDKVRPKDTPRRDEDKKEDAPQEDDDTSSRGHGQGQDDRQDQRGNGATDRDDKDNDRERDPGEKPSETEREGANTEQSEDDEESEKDDEDPRGSGQGDE